MKDKKEDKEDDEPRTYIQIADVICASDTANLKECSKTALNIHRLRNRFKPSYLG